MKNKELVTELLKRDPDGNVQLYIENPEGQNAYYSVMKVNGFIDMPDTIIEAGEVLQTGT